MNEIFRQYDAKERKRNQLTSEREREGSRRGKGTTKLLIYIVGFLCSANVGKPPGPSHALLTASSRMCVFKKHFGRVPMYVCF